MNLWGQWIRFLATGVGSVALNVLIVYGLTRYAGLHYLASIAVCFCTVTPISFVLNRRWTFEKRDGRAWLEISRYVLVNLSYLALSLILVRLLVDVGHVPYLLATVLLSVIFAPLNFLMHRQWSFSLPWIRR